MLGKEEEGEKRGAGSREVEKNIFTNFPRIRGKRIYGFVQAPPEFYGISGTLNERSKISILLHHVHQNRPNVPETEKRKPRSGFPTSEIFPEFLYCVRSKLR
jgi:hypothetical protein